MFICRFFFFHLYESPKFLLSRGRQAEAVATVHGIAYKNKRQTWLTEEILNEIGGVQVVETHAKLSTMEIIRRSLGKFSSERISPLFSTRRLGIMSKQQTSSTNFTSLQPLLACLIWFCWATVGMGTKFLLSG